MDSQLGDEITLALACAGFSAQRHEYDAIREVVYEQVNLMTSVLRIPLQDGCVFIEKPETPDKSYLNAVWLGTAEHIFRMDVSTPDLQSTIGFRVEIIKPSDVTEVAIEATRWYNETPTSDSALTVDFAVRGRPFHLTARMPNCEQLQKLIRIVLQQSVPSPLALT